MDYGYEDRRPSEHYFVPALPPPPPEPPKPADFLWLERYLPYTEGGEVHWFMRFPQ